MLRWQSEIKSISLSPAFRFRSPCSAAAMLSSACVGACLAEEASTVLVTRDEPY